MSTTEDLRDQRSLFDNTDAASAVQDARRRQDDLLRSTRTAQNALHAAGIVAATQTWEVSSVGTDF